MPAARVPHRTADSLTTPLRTVPALGAAALTGMLTALSYPGQVSVWPLALLASCPLYVAVQGQSLVRRIAYGWLAGSVTVALSAHWLPAAYQRITGASEASGAALQALFCAWHGLDLALLVVLAPALSAALPRSLAWALEIPAIGVHHIQDVHGRIPPQSGTFGGAWLGPLMFHLLPYIEQTA